MIRNIKETPGGAPRIIDDDTLGKLKKFFKKTRKLLREKSALKKIICFLLRFRADIAIKIYSASVEFHILESFINTTNVQKIARKNVI